MTELEALSKLPNLPKHIAIIMDGNGRWAKEHGKERVLGHYEGVKTVRKIVEACSRVGIDYLTLYAFSTENWHRPSEEIKALMELLVSTIKGETPTLNKNNISLEAIGNLALLPKDCASELQEAIAETSQNTGLKLILALSYSARWDIVNACQKLLKEQKKLDLDIDQLSPEGFSQYLTTAAFPDPELLIRTSGEYRISNFLLWELAYTEMYFSQKMWPEFTESDLIDAIKSFLKRERRFGKLSEQINEKQL